MYYNVYISENYEHLTQDVINNPTEALIQLNGNVTNFVAEREQRFAMKQLAEQKIKEQKLAIEKKKLEDKIKEQKRLKELEDKSCSDICFKEFKKVSKMLQLIPSSDADCKMCMNRFFTIVPANAVFYPCGHNFVCFKCANSYWNNGKACGCKGCLINSKVVCPICRVAIKDVIKSYSPL